MALGAVRCGPTAVLILLPVLALAAVTAFSLLQAPNLGDGIAEVVKWAEFTLVIVLLPTMLTRKHVLWMCAALMAGGAAQALIGVYQFVYQVGPEWFVLFDRYMRASGTFRQPNPYAAYLGVALPVAVSMSIWLWIQALRPSYHRVSLLVWALVFTLGSGIIGLGLLLSWSRGGWLAAVAALVAVIAFRSMRGFLLSAGVLIAGMLAMLFGSFASPLLSSAIGERFSGALSALTAGDALNQSVNDANFALMERLAHWVAALRMWESTPWFGVGAGNYEAVYDAFALPLWTEALGHAHNLYLNLLAETGLVGFTVFVTMWAGLAIWAFGCRFADKPYCDGWCAAMSAAVLGSLIYITIHSMVDVLFVQGIYLELALIVATLAAGCTNTSSQQVLHQR